MTLSSQDFELLLQANRILSSKLNVEDVLQAVMELATKVVKAEASSLLLLDEKTNELYFDVALGEVGAKVKQIRLKMGEGIAGWVAKENRPLIVNDVKADARFTGKVDDSTEFSTRNIMAVPLRAKGKLIGVVEAINKENHQEFTNSDREAFGIFSSQAAIAIENARLFSAISEEKEKLGTVFSEMSEGVFYLDQSAKILISNAVVQKLMGQSPGELLGKKFGPDIFKEFEIAPSIQDISTFQDDVTEVHLKRQSTKDLFLAAQIHRLKSPDDEKMYGYLVILRDVTEEMRGEKLKRNFLSLVSHKLKTPLTVILGYAPTLMMKADQLNEMQKKAFTSIHQQSEHMAGLVDKLLRYTVVESESVGKHASSQALEPLIKEALDSQETLIKKNNVSVRVDEKAKDWPKVFVDGPLTVEVFKNLLENAIKFNNKDKREIVISGSKKGRHLTVALFDNGPGIPPEEQVKIFQKFYQIENSFTGQVPGAGLGLPYCKKVMEEMGGTITVQSALGKGSKFSVSFVIG